MEQGYNFSKILEFVYEVEDFRTGNRLCYPASSILFMAILGFLCNARNWQEVVDICEESEDILIEYLKDDYVGVASKSTFYRFFSLITPIALERAFRQVMEAQRKSQHSDDEQECIAVDGKYLRGVTDQSALNVVSLYSTEHGLCLGQQEAERKMNEPEVLRSLVKELNIKGAVITADALHCQKESVKTIIEEGGDYLICVKQNQAKLMEAIISGVEGETIRGKKRYIDYAEEAQEGHGRKERRVCRSCSHLGWIPEVGKKWEGIKSFGTVTAYRTVVAQGKTSCETRCFISSLPMDAARQLVIMRNHWKIENNLHWQLDVTFAEDLSRMLKNQLLNISLLRKLIMPPVKDFQYKKGASLKAKMFAALIKPNVRKQLIKSTVQFYSNS